MEKTSLKTIEETLYTTNEYGVRYQNPDARLSEQEVEYLGRVHKIRTDVHRTCINCQARQTIKYEKSTDKEGKSLKDFKVPCSYIAKALPPGSATLIETLMADKNISRERATLVMRATQDPVAWAELMFGFDDRTKGTATEWYLRNYQKEQLRCLRGDTVVYMADGTTKLLRDIVVGDKVLSYNKKKKSYVGKRVLNKFQNGERELYKVTSYNGDAVHVTDDHPILSYVHAGEINQMFGAPSKMTTYRSISEGLGSHPDDRVYIATGFEKFGEMDNEDLAKLLGYIVTDGYVTSSSRKVEFANIRESYVMEFAELAERVFPGIKYTISMKPSHIGNDGSLRQNTWIIHFYGQENPLLVFLRSIGCTDKSNREMSILRYAFTFTRAALSGFLNRVWAGDGCVYSSRNPTIKERGQGSGGSWKTALTLSSGNREFLQMFRHLLRKVGIFRTFIYRQHKDSKSLSLNVQSIAQVKKFFEEVGPIFGKEEQSLFAINNLVSTNKMKGQFKHSGRFAIESIEPAGKEITYDIEVEGLHNFIADGFIVHNCSSRRIVIREGRRSGKSFIVALKLIYMAYTQVISRGNSDGSERLTGPSILIVTPYQAQVTNIFEEIESLLNRSPDLAKEVTSGTNGNLYVKTPFLRMEFANGGKISGFVSGVGTKTDGSAGGTLRGQSADIIYLDEMDMIPDEVLKKVVLPIMATRKGTSMIATSTPIGKRGTFYKWALEDPTFKEDHLPSTVLPQWNEIKDLLIGDSTPESFAAEYMATFIDGGFGVFKPSLVWEARQDYSYDFTSQNHYLKEKLKVQRPEMMLKCIGIDWNKNAGSEFWVVGFDIDAGEWIVLETVNVSASEFSSIRWKEEVIRLNYKWKPDYIYADEGYGHTIIEDLKLMAHNVRAGPKPTLQHVETAKLVDRLVSFNFSSKVELRSPIDRSIIEKSGKDFLVENAVRIFEDQKITFAVGDEQLRKELLNYKVLRRTPTTNRPIYGPENSGVGDHRLDAFMLAVGGLYLENSEYSPNMRSSSKPTFLSKQVLEERAPVKEASGISAIKGLKRAASVNSNAMEIVRSIGDGSSGVTPKENRVTRRGGSAPDTDVYDHYKKLKGNKGIDTDEEHLYRPISEPMIGRRKPHNNTRGPRRDWLRR